MNKYVLKTLLAFAVGGLLGDVFLHLLPHAQHTHTHGAHEGMDATEDLIAVLDNELQHTVSPVSFKEYVKTELSKAKVSLQDHLELYPDQKELIIELASIQDYSSAEGVEYLKESEEAMTQHCGKVLHPIVGQPKLCFYLKKYHTVAQVLTGRQVKCGDERLGSFSCPCGSLFVCV